MVLRHRLRVGVEVENLVTPVGRAPARDAALCCTCAGGAFSLWPDEPQPMAQVVNVRSAKPGSFLYVGRCHPRFRQGSIFGNPFSPFSAGKLIEKSHSVVTVKSKSAAESLEQHRAWLAGELYIDEALDELLEKVLASLPKLTDALAQGLSLGCWCAPNPCHAQTLLDWATQSKSKSS